MTAYLSPLSLILWILPDLRAVSALRSALVTADWIAEIYGTSYSTAAGAVRQLGAAILRHSNRKLELEYLPSDGSSRA